MTSTRVALSLGVLVGGAAGALAIGLPDTSAAPGDCPVAPVGQAYAATVRTALASGRDTWGERLIASASGPTLAGARRYLAPLRLARAPGGKALTDSGVYYLPFAQPDGPRGAGTVALHVADGSQVIAQRVGGRSLTLLVGPAGRERYGACPRRLAPARLGRGYLPILETSYRDAAGGRYAQESFAARIPQTRSLVSFVRLDVDTRDASKPVVLRLEPSTTDLRRRSSTLARGAETELAFSAGGTVASGQVSYVVPVGARTTIFAAWLATPSRLGAFALDETTYEAARASVPAYWDSRLASGMGISVPEPAVMDALRATLIQSLMLTWRYSIGNPYEQFSFPESPDVARVLTELGFGPAARSVLRTSLTRSEDRYPSWKRGSRLVALAEYVSLTGDASPADGAAPQLRSWLASFERQLASTGRDLLTRERYSSDIPDQVYGLHAQATVWQGLREMASVWRDEGEMTLSTRASAISNRLERGLRRAVGASQRRLADGSLFVPVQLLDGESPYPLLVEQRLGSYWNLVAPYALASGLFPPGSTQARGLLRYLELHGGRLLGVARAGAYALYGRDAFPASGTNQVYNTNVVRFLADNDEADEIVLSLYGSLAIGMTPGTFVAGEAASVSPLSGTPDRAMYLPPNNGANTAFLETVRTALVHETRDRAGRSAGLELAFATPRGWLRPGGRIEVTDAPTSFGMVSYAIAATQSAVTVTVAAPERRPESFTLRLRLPAGTRIAGIVRDGIPFDRFDRRSGTIDLSGLRGSHSLHVSITR